MSDLISRSALKKEVEGFYIHGVRSGKGILAKCMDSYKELVIKIIDEQPTAYNVDAVVAELEEEREYSYADFEEYVNEKSPCLDAEYDDYFHRGLERAIKLVKKGGVE